MGNLPNVGDKYHHKTENGTFTVIEADSWPIELESNGGTSRPVDEDLLDRMYTGI